MNQNYMNNMQYTPSYMGYTQPYMAYQQQQYQPRQQMPMQQPQQQSRQDVPFSEVRYGTLDQAKGFIVMPNTAVMFIDQDKSEFYINRADSMGKPYLETYKYYSMSNLPQEQKTSDGDGKFDGKPAQSEQYLTRKDLVGLVTLKDLEDINTKIDQLQKKIKINDMMAGEGKKNDLR